MFGLFLAWHICILMYLKRKFVKTVISIVLNNFKNDSRVLKENISLQNANYDVKVIALHDEGQKQFDLIQNIPVHRIKLKSRALSKNKLVQILKYFEFMYRVIKNYKNNDIFHCNDLNALPIGIMIKKIFNKNAKVVYDAHEHECERYNQSTLEKKISKILENFLIKYVDAVITVSDSIANDYSKIYNIKKPYLVYNTPNYIDIEKKDIFRETFNIPKSNTIFLYQGGLSSGRGILEFAELIKDKINVSYIIMGYGTLEKDAINLSKKEKNIFFHKVVSPDVLLYYTSSADIGVCIEENTCKSWDYALPNKMFEYHMVKLPIIVSGLSEMKKFVKENHTGYIIENIFDKKEFDILYENIMSTHKNKIDSINKVRKVF